MVSIIPSNTRLILVIRADFALNSEFFKLNVQFLYIFLSQFPTYFKKWLDNTSKTNISMAQSVIKTFISSTLFMDEIEIIETKQEGNLLPLLVGQHLTTNF